MKRLVFSGLLILCAFSTFAQAGNSVSPYLEPVSYTMDSGVQSMNYVLLTLPQVKGTISRNDLSSFWAGTYSGENKYRIASDVFIKITTEKLDRGEFRGRDWQYIDMYDSNGKFIRDSNTEVVKRVYNIDDNDDYDEYKKYRVYYTCQIGRIDGYMIDQIDFIEGLAPYSETLANRRNAAEELERQELTQRSAEVEKIYSDALATTGTAELVEYINTYSRDDNFNEDSYAEIARRIAGNRNTAFKEIINAPNPYAFDTETVYYCDGLIIQNFIRGQLIVSMPNLHRGEISLIVLHNVPDIIKLEDYITNAYLKYTGITTVSLSNGGTRELATFTVIFNF